MSTETFLIIGAGGHSMVVLDALQLSGAKADIRILDESPDRIGRTVLGLAVLPFDRARRLAGERFHAAIGDNDARAGILAALKAAGGSPATIVHPAATIARSASIGEATFVAARAIVAPVAVVSEGVIVNHGAVVDHECVIGSHCHLAPGVTLGGNVRVGSRVFIGAGANILPGVSIGDAVTIGAGAVVRTDVPPGTTYVGVPARKLR
jgi:sugar O-acyltransferase (sialic acid O-acetyltransferase NeuD family)